MRAHALVLMIATLTACTGEKLDTGAAGDSIVGKTYEVDLGKGDVAGAEDLAATIDAVLTSPVLTSITAQAGDTIDMRLGLGVDENPVSQDLCARTLDMPQGSFDGTNIAIGPDTVSFNANGDDYTLEDFEVSGALSADGNSIEDMSLGLTIDMEQAAAYLGSDDGQSVCDDLIAPLGLTCGSCSDGGTTCLSVTMTGIPADGVDVTLEKVAESNAAEGCEG